MSHDADFGSERVDFDGTEGSIATRAAVVAGTSLSLLELLGVAALNVEVVLGASKGLRLDWLVKHDLVVDLRSPAFGGNDRLRCRYLHWWLQNGNILLESLSVAPAVPGIVLNIDEKIVSDAHNFAGKRAGERC